MYCIRQEDAGRKQLPATAFMGFTVLAWHMSSPYLLQWPPKSLLYCTQILHSPQNSPHTRANTVANLLSLAGPWNSIYTEGTFSVSSPTTALLALSSVEQWLSLSLTVPLAHIRLHLPLQFREFTSLVSPSRTAHLGLIQDVAMSTYYEKERLLSFHLALWRRKDWHWSFPSLTTHQNHPRIVFP